MRGACRTLGMSTTAEGAGHEFDVVDVEPCEASEDGVMLRFKRVLGEGVRSVKRVRYESEDGLDGWWRAEGVGAGSGGAGSGETKEAAVCSLVEDSGAGTVQLVRGGARGLRLVHEETGTVEREAYLLLSTAASIE
jgi:hypothetical protein